MKDIVLEPVLPTHLHTVRCPRPDGSAWLRCRTLPDGRSAVRTFMFRADAEAHKAARTDEVQYQTVKQIHEVVLRLQQQGVDAIGFVIDEDPEVHRL